MNHKDRLRAAFLSLLYAALTHKAAAQDCGALAPAERQHCEDLFARRVQSASRISQLPGGWRLIKTPDPGGGPEAVSVMHAADTAKSDADFAGLTFRCGQTGIETLLILLSPLQRGSGYRVTVRSGTTQTQLEAKAVQGGEVLLLPPGATALGGGPWQAASELSVEIAAPTPIRGTVPTGGLSSAFLTLSQSCPKL